MLRVASISKTYSADARLPPLSFELQPHEIVFLVAPSGSGKTTALRGIANLHELDAGSVTMDSRSPQQMGFSLWRRHVMYVPQHRVALSGTPAELFTRALRFRSYRHVCQEEHEAQREAQREAQLQHYVAICRSMALTRDNICCQQWSELSAGQAQRATVSLCLALRPKVLLLDEPSSNCDFQSTLQMEQAIKRSRIAAVWVSHDNSQPQRVGGRILNIDK